MNGGHLVEQVVVEPAKVHGEPAEFVRVDNGLSHDTPFRFVTDRDVRKREPTRQWSRGKTIHRHVGDVRTDSSYLVRTGE